VTCDKENREKTNRKSRSRFRKGFFFFLWGEKEKEGGNSLEDIRRV